MALDLREKDRRYKIIKEKMSAQGLDAVIVMNSAQINEKGFVKYLTNYRSILYNLVVIFRFKGRCGFSSRVPSRGTGLIFWAGSPVWRSRYPISMRAY